ncbi:hypothetical protein M422DRAFT_252970 [Sphaerobolus stellatus SS14]|uniref:Uncharacterized protein n=1 Tax=Sphaerobolus stellatus (strain SS14) TaxID=990650 RepID=A0A0C9UKX2_SPHS4|nr:hypothetical protein M422DRAFT_252970 [Sphaerobolus stellatus SS14]
MSVTLNKHLIGSRAHDCRGKCVENDAHDLPGTSSAAPNHIALIIFLFSQHQHHGKTIDPAGITPSISARRSAMDDTSSCASWDRVISRLFGWSETRSAFYFLIQTLHLILDNCVSSRT